MSQAVIFLGNVNHTYFGALCTPPLAPCASFPFSQEQGLGGTWGKESLGQRHSPFTGQSQWCHTLTERRSVWSSNPNWAGQHIPSCAPRCVLVWWTVLVPVLSSGVSFHWADVNAKPVWKKAWFLLRAWLLLWISIFLQSLGLFSEAHQREGIIETIKKLSWHLILFSAGCVFWAFWQ